MTSIDPHMIHNFFGMNEIAEILGVPRSTVSSWKARHQLPAPAGTLSGTQLWLRTTIIHWAEQHQVLARNARISARHDAEETQRRADNREWKELQERVIAASNKRGGTHDPQSVTAFLTLQDDPQRWQRADWTQAVDMLFPGDADVPSIHSPRA